MILSPGFIYFRDGGEWEDNDVYIKYYWEKKTNALRIMFLYEKYIRH